MSMMVGENIAESAEALVNETELSEEAKLAKVFEDFASTPMAKEIKGEVRRVMGIAELFELCPHFASLDLSADYIRDQCEIAAEDYFLLKDISMTGDTISNDSMEESQKDEFTKSPSDDAGYFEAELVKDAKQNKSEGLSDVTINQSSVNNRTSRQLKQENTTVSTINAANEQIGIIESAPIFTNTDDNKNRSGRSITDSLSTTIVTSEGPASNAEITLAEVVVVETDTKSAADVQPIADVVKLDKNDLPTSTIQTDIVISKESEAIAQETVDIPVLATSSLVEAANSVDEIEMSVPVVVSLEDEDEVGICERQSFDEVVIELELDHSTNQFENGLVEVNDSAPDAEIEHLHEILSYLSDELVDVSVAEQTESLSGDIEQAEVNQEKIYADHGNDTEFYASKITTQTEIDEVLDQLEVSDTVNALHCCLKAQLCELTDLEHIEYQKQNDLPRQAILTLETLFKEIGVKDPELSTRLYLEKYGVSGLLDIVQRPMPVNSLTKNLVACLARFVTSLLHDSAPAATTRIAA